jgi:hypothetical protein
VTTSLRLKATAEARSGADLEGAGEDEGRAGVGVFAGQGERAAAGLGEGAVAADDAGVGVGIGAVVLEHGAGGTCALPAIEPTVPALPICSVPAETVVVPA